MKSIVLLLGFLFFNSAYSQVGSFSANDIRIVNEIITREMCFQEIDGLSIGIVRDGEIVYTDGFGYMDKEKQIPATTSTIFTWASISKTLTAAAAWKLIESGNLSMEDKVKPILRTSWTNESDDDEISVEHLLTHRSGICHYSCTIDGVSYNGNEDNYTDTSSDWNYQQSIGVFAHIPVVFTPGKSFKYSTYAYNLLGAVVGKKSRVGYVSYINNVIKEPLGLNSLTFDDDWQGFQKDCYGTPQEKIVDDLRPKLPGGGWRSDIIDLTKFMSALLIDGILNETSRMWRPVFYNGKAINNYGFRYGVEYEQDHTNNQPVISHGGSNFNSQSLMAFMPNSKFGIAIMANSGHADLKKIFNCLTNDLGIVRPHNEDWSTRCGSEGCLVRMAATYVEASKPTILRAGYDLVRLLEDKSKLEKKGYYLEDIEVFLYEDQIRYDAKYLKGSKISHLVINKTKEELEQIITINGGEGIQLYDIETHFVKNELKFTSVFIEEPYESDFIGLLGKKSFNLVRLAMQKKGKTLFDVEIILTASGNLYSGIWKKGAQRTYVPGLEETRFESRISEETKNGRRLRDVEIIIEDKTIKYVAIFEPTDGPSIYFPRLSYCGVVNNANAYSNFGYYIYEFERF